MVRRTSERRGDLQVQFGVAGAADDLGLPGLVGAARVLEEPQLELERQDTPYRRLDLRLLERAGRDRVLGALEELGRGHHDVVARVHRRGGGLRVVGVHPLLPHHAADVVPVGHQRAGVAPLAPQHVVEQPVVDGDRHTVHGLVAEHERTAALARDPLEGGQEPGAQLAPRDVGLAGVPAALRLGVAGEVLGAGQDRGRVGQSVALVAADHRGGQLADEEGVLAERLADAAPAQVARDAQHRGEGPVDAGRRDLDGRRPGDALHEVGVPGRGHAELGGVDRGTLPEGVPVDAVLRDEQRDAQARPLGQLGRFEDALGRGVQDRPGVHVLDEVPYPVLRVQLEHLTDLLGQGHPTDEVVDALRDGQSGVEVGRQGAHSSSFHNVECVCRANTRRKDTVGEPRDVGGRRPSPVTWPATRSGHSDSR